MASRCERAAVELVERIRWGDLPKCPRCASISVYKMRRRGKPGRERYLRWRCRACLRMFTVRTGTAFEDSKIPMRSWLEALGMDGPTAREITARIGVCHETALFVKKRLDSLRPSGTRA